jgi:hypothetical protein
VMEPRGGGRLWHVLRLKEGKGVRGGPSIQAQSLEAAALWHYSSAGRLLPLLKIGETRSAEEEGWERVVGMVGLLQRGRNGERGMRGGILCQRRREWGVRCMERRVGGPVRWQKRRGPGCSRRWRHTVDRGLAAVATVHAARGRRGAGEGEGD